MRISQCRTLNITLASGLHKTNHESPWARFPAAAGAGAGASSPPSSYWSGVRCGNSLGASTCLVLPTTQSVQYCKGNDNCFFRLCCCFTGENKIQMSPYDNKIAFYLQSIPQWSYSYYFTCLISINNQCWTNWVLTGGSLCINTSVVKQECFTKNNTMQSLLLQ